MIGQLTLNTPEPEAQITVCAHRGLRSAGEQVVHRGKGALDAKARTGRHPPRVAEQTAAPALGEETSPAF